MAQYVRSEQKKLMCINWNIFAVGVLLQVLSWSMFHGSNVEGPLLQHVLHHQNFCTSHHLNKFIITSFYALEVAQVHLLYISSYLLILLVTNF